MLTYEFSRFVLPLVDEILERFLHGVDELFILGEAYVDVVVYLVFEVWNIYKVEQKLRTENLWETEHAPGIGAKFLRRTCARIRKGRTPPPVRQGNR